MRLLHWTELFLPHIGGMEVLVDALSQELCNRGHHLLVVTAHTGADLPDHERHGRVEIRRFRFHEPLTKRDISGIKEVQSQIAALKRYYAPHVIHCHACFSEPSLFFHLTTRDDTPCVVTLHRSPREYSAAGGLSHKLLKEARKITTVSQAVASGLLDVWPELAHKTEVMPNSLPLPDVPPAPLPDPFRMLCLGRMVKDKGFDIAVRAHALVVRKIPEARMTLVGDGPEKGALERLIRELDLKRCVELRNWSTPEEVPDLINSFSLVVVPSRWEEPFGLVALQAAQLGRPVVASKCGGLPEIVNHGSTGLLCDKDDPAALATMLLKLASRPEDASRMGLTARNRARERFDFGKLVNGFETLYERAGKVERR